MKLPALALLILPLSATAFAPEKEKPKFVIACQTGDTLSSDDIDCENNSVFSKAGEACATAVDEAVKKKSGEVALAMAAINLAHTADGKNAQSANFAGASADYAASVEALQNLIRAAKVVRAKVADLPNHIYYPEDWDAPEEVIGDPVQFLDNQPCYNDARTSLEKSLAKVNNQIADLERGLKAAQAKGGTSTGRQADTGSLTPNQQEGGRTSAGPTPVPGAKGNYVPGKSGISGTEDKKGK